MKRILGVIVAGCLLFSGAVVGFAAEQTVSEEERLAIDGAIASALGQYQDGYLYESRAAAANILTFPTLNEHQREDTIALLRVIDDAIAVYLDSFNVKAVVYVANVENSVYLRAEPNLNASIICTIPFANAVGWISNNHNGFTRVEYSGMYGYIKSEYLSNKKPVKAVVKNAADANWYAELNYGESASFTYGPYDYGNIYYYDVDIWSPYSYRYMATIRVWQDGVCEMIDHRGHGDGRYCDCSISSNRRYSGEAGH